MSTHLRHSKELKKKSNSENMIKSKTVRINKSSSMIQLLGNGMIIVLHHSFVFFLLKEINSAVITICSNAHLSKAVIKQNNFFAVVIFNYRD